MQPQGESYRDKIKTRHTVMITKVKKNNNLVFIFKIILSPLHNFGSEFNTSHKANAITSILYALNLRPLAYLFDFLCLIIYQ